MLMTFLLFHTISCMSIVAIVHRQAKMGIDRVDSEINAFPYGRVGTDCF